MDQKVAEQFKKISEAYLVLASLLESEGESTKPSKTTTAKTGKAAKPVETKTEDENGYDPEQLKTMKLAELKKLAEELGLDKTGSRDDLVDRICGGAEEPEGSETADGDGGEEQSPEDELERAQEIANGMELEELAEILRNAGLNPSGKKSMLVAKVVKAVKEGKISLDSEDDGESAGAADGLPDDETMSETDIEARLSAMDDAEASIRKQFKLKKLTEKQIDEFLVTGYPDEEPSSFGDSAKEKLESYIDLKKRLIDDEGVEHDFNDPYVVNGYNACCGHYLKPIDDGFVCETCGESYK